MRKVRGPVWWYGLRYDLDWRIPVVTGTFVVMLAIMCFYGVASPQVSAERRRQAETRCMTNGGHIVLTVQKFGISRICYGG